MFWMIENAHLLFLGLWAVSIPVTLYILYLVIKALRRYTSK